MTMKSEPVKIGFIFNQSLFLGGGEHSLFLLIAGLRHSAFEPVGIVPGEGEILERLKAHGVPAAVCPLGSLRRGVGASFFRDVKTLARAARDRGIGIIHANGSRACLYGGIVGRTVGIPVVWHVRETIRDHFLYDGLLGLLATRIVCASRAIVQERFARFGTLLGRKTTVVHNGVVPADLQRDGHKRAAIRAELGLGENDALMGMLGNFIPLKGHEFLIQGVAAALKRNPRSGLKLLCIGRTVDPDYHRRVLALVREQGLEERVIFREYTTDVAGMLSAADIFVLPSKREGFSRSLLEAMAMGLPVIATRIAAIAEAVEDRTGGMLVEDGDVAALAQAILALCGSADLRKRMGERNRERVLQRFTADIHQKAIENLYATLLRRDVN